MSSLDSRAAFKARAEELSLEDDTYKKLVTAKLDTFGALAFIGPLQAGSADETPLIEALKSATSHVVGGCCRCALADVASALARTAKLLYARSQFKLKSRLRFSRSATQTWSLQCVARTWNSCQALRCDQ